MVLINFNKAVKNSFTKHVLGSRGELVYLIQGKNKGKDAWHYIQVHKPKHTLFRNHLESGRIDLSGYGEILYSGWGINPPQYVQEELEERFG